MSVADDVWNQRSCISHSGVDFLGDLDGVDRDAEEWAALSNLEWPTFGGQERDKRAKVIKGF